MFKKIKLIALSSLLLTSFLLSCGEDSDGGGIPSLGKLSATIDGSKWVGTNATGVVVSASSINTLTIGGTKVNSTNPNASEIMSVTIYGALGAELTTGDYTIESDAVPKGQITYQVGFSASDSWYATSGTVSITKITDTNFQGTFSGTLTKTNSSETKTVTDGGFNVNKSSF